MVGDLEDGGDGAGVEIGMAVVPYWDERVADDGTVVLLPQWRRA